MSRLTPKLLDGHAHGFNRIKLTKAQVDRISDECGTPVGAEVKRIERALNSYFLNAVVSDTATPVSDAEARLDKLLALATELLDLNEEPGREPDRFFRYWLRDRLNRDCDAASRLCDALYDYIEAARSVRAGLLDEKEKRWSAELARELEIIWTRRLKIKRTISPSKHGSDFVRFVLAATHVLPSHWPWRPPGRREPQSIDAVVTALRRELNR